MSRPMSGQPGTILPCLHCRRHGWHEAWCVIGGSAAALRDRANAAASKVDAALGGGES